MAKIRSNYRLRPAFCAVALLANSPLAIAATSSTLDVLPDTSIASRSDIPQLGPLKSLDDKVLQAPVQIGNPLWSIPLSSLAATTDRPIFSESRRPVPRAVAGPMIASTTTSAPTTLAEPEHSTLALVGVVVSDTDAIAVFVDQATQRMVRLRQGEVHSGWQLVAVQARNVSLKKADQTDVLNLPRPSMSAPALEPVDMAPQADNIGNAGRRRGDGSSTPR